MDRKRKVSIFHSARHKRRLVAQNTLTDIETITHQTKHSITIINTQDVDEHDNNSLLICNSQDTHLDRNLSQSDSNEENVSNENNTCLNNVALNCRNASNNQTLVDNCFSNYEDTCLNDNEAFLHDIGTWAIDENVSHKSLHRLLQILQKHTNYDLPKDPRTLLQTPQSTQIIQIEGGDYCHLGLEKVLIKIAKERKRLNFTFDDIQLYINIDGLPIYKSSEKSLWPILCSDRIINNVYVIALYYGEGKPKDANEFLKMFVDEAIIFTNNGLHYQGQIIKVKIKAIICDVPAKSFVLSVKHNGYDSCTKCLIEGENIEGRICFPYTSNITLRSDEAFFTGSYSLDYQTGDTILKNIPNLGLITNVPLDYMHLVCLGVMRKLIMLWLSGPLNTRLSNLDKEKMSKKLIKLRNSIPFDFARRPRSLKYIKHWKATEFRQFLLYTGPIVLKGLLQENAYIHFLTFHVAITILAHPSLAYQTSVIEYAENLLKHFVKSFQIIYGAKYISHNVHNLLHLAADVKNFGTLDEFSAFKFENYMSVLKRLIRKTNQPLQQLTRRFAEIEIINNNKTFNIYSNYTDFDNVGKHFEKSHCNSPITEDLICIQQYKIFRNNRYYINCDDPKNNCISFENGQTMSILNFIKSNDNKMYVIGKMFLPVKDLYVQPCSSTTLDISIMFEDSYLQTWQFDKIKAKMWKIPYKKNYIICPILHTDN